MSLLGVRLQNLLSTTRLLSTVPKIDPSHERCELVEKEAALEQRNKALTFTNSTIKNSKEDPKSDITEDELQMRYGTPPSTGC